MSLEGLFSRRALGIRLELETIRTVFAALGQPGARIPAIHIVGTNGKGSIAAMCAHALSQRGRSVGLYTSPHLQTVMERVRIGGDPVSEAELSDAVGRVLAQETASLPRPLSFFEVLTLAALCVFEQHNVDVIVAEAGLGGRWDATRLVSSAAIAVATLGLDHQAWLGSTLTAITLEKAAVFRREIPVFTGPQPAEAQAVLQAEAERVGAPLVEVVPWPRPPRGLEGAFQCINAAVAYAASRALCTEVEPGDLDGVSWPARLERWAWEGGEVIFDAAHNAPAVAEIVAHLSAESPISVVFGCASDKDSATMLRSLSELGPVLWVPLEAGQAPPHASEELVVRTLPDPTSEALEDEVLATLQRGGRVLVCGSHRLVGLLRGRWRLGSERQDPTDPRGGPKRER